MPMQTSRTPRLLTPLAFALSLFLVTGLAGCEEESPAERAAEDVSDTMESAGDEIEDAAGEVQDEAEEAADDVDDEM